MRTTSTYAWVAVLLSCGVCIAGVALAGIQLTPLVAPVELRIPATAQPESFVVRGDIRVLRSCDAAGCSIWLDRRWARPCYGQIHGENTCFDVLLASAPADEDAFVTVHPDWQRHHPERIALPSAYAVLSGDLVVWPLTGLLLLLYLLQLYRRDRAQARQDWLAAARPATVTADGTVQFEDSKEPTRGVLDSPSLVGPAAACVLTLRQPSYRDDGCAVCETEPGFIATLRHAARARLSDAEALLHAFHLVAFPTLALFLLATGHFDLLWDARNTGDCLVAVGAIVGLWSRVWDRA